MPPSAGDGPPPPDDHELQDDPPLAPVPNIRRLSSQRRMPDAENRLPGKWVIREQLKGRQVTCTQCIEAIEHQQIALSRLTDRSTGGRWVHVHCVSGGLRTDDTLITETVLQPAGHHFLNEHQEKPSAPTPKQPTLTK